MSPPYQIAPASATPRNANLTPFGAQSQTDLDEAIARTDRGDIIAVYQRLRQGSENHLRAFTGGGGRRN